MNLVRTACVALVGLAAGEAIACSAVIAGRKASATGRVLVAHNDDGALDLRMRYALVPAREGKLSYFWSESKKPSGGCTPGDTMLNECGVIVLSDIRVSKHGDCLDFTGLPRAAEATGSGIIRLHEQLRRK